MSIHRSVVLAVWVVSAVLLACSAAQADEDAAALRRPPMGSLARQRLLMMRLQQITTDSLAETLKHNRQDWEQLTADERKSYRQSFLAFLQKTPKQQDQLLKRYEKLFKMTAQRRADYRRRAKWLRVVVDSFSAEQRQELREMSPDDRAKELLARKARLIRDGKLEAEPTSSQPASSAASQPAKTPAE